MIDLTAIIRERVPGNGRVAVGVSGGPDSMALAWLLSQAGIDTLAITLDHGLRGDSAAEAVQVGTWIADWPCLAHHVLIRPMPATSTRVMERAREDRYRLLTRCCEANGIATLLTAHHQGDQAETLLFRLAKGSGLDGLAGIERETPLSPNVTLLRPLLDVPKAKLVALCAANNIPFINDPSNLDEHYARPRLRRALEDEGANPARLAATARRLRRARQALAFFTDEALARTTVLRQDSEIRLDRALLAAYPEDIRIRAIALLLARLGNPDQAAGVRHVRLAKVESLTIELFAATGPFRVTLHRCIIDYDPATDLIRVVAERDGLPALRKNLHL